MSHSVEPVKLIKEPLREDFKFEEMSSEDPTACSTALGTAVLQANTVQVERGSTWAAGASS
jgi:hypothetical protein